MTLRAGRQSLDGVEVFLSASIPDPMRWNGPFDALGITDAVVAVARAILFAGGRLVTAAHPTIAPLLLYVAAEQGPSISPSVLIYQSAVFDAILPDATRQFEAEGVGRVIRTAAVDGEVPDPAQATQSLALMRHQMLSQEPLAGAIFIGGMEGIPDEYALFGNLHPRSPTYAFGVPGGSARSLVEFSPPDLGEKLATSAIYPAVARAIVNDLVVRDTPLNS